ncbi:unnamed protein product, partial [Brugia timori]|uniref:SSD domain-containing protein n=1 Tax=Brugia timori TaxID=42155 RepID=A0A0R3QX59_9BILA
SYLYISSKPFYEAISVAIKIQSDKNAVLGYPTMNLYGINFTIRNVFRRYSNLLLWNGKQSYSNGFVGMLVYSFIFLDNQDVVSSIKRAEIEWRNKLKRSNESGVRFRLFGDEIVNNEIFVGSVGSLPYFLTGFLAMVIFIFLSILHYNQTFLQTVFLTLWTTLCPCLAGLTSVAIFSILGRTLNPSILITPFLILAVGVDDAFLVLHKWFTSVEIDSLSRLISVLVEIGPSITLTSVTNICAFMISSFFSPNAIREFCYCSALAIMLDWIFQILVFTPVLLKIHSCSFNISRKGNKRCKSPFKSYCEFLMHPVTRITLFCILIPFWIYNIYLALRMEENFTPQKTIRSDSFLTDSLPILENVRNSGLSRTMYSWRDRAFIHKQVREKMPEEMLVYDYDCTLFDIILTARETMLQSCVITSITMLAICTLFIPSARATAFVFLSMISVTTGADMDIIVTISVVMAIGLTIDYAEHINYHHFVMNSILPPIDRMSSSLQAITYATVQAATTTLICVLPLYSYNVYMYVTFAEAIILCSIFGLLHAVVVIPFLFLFF